MSGTKTAAKHGTRSAREIEEERKKAETLLRAPYSYEVYIPGY